MWFPTQNPALGTSGFNGLFLGGKPASQPEGAKNYYVDPANGSDSNSGLPHEALKTVSEAYDRTVANRGDVVYVLNDGNTSGSVRESSGLVWAKDNTHLIGICSPSINQRSRITPTSGSTDVDAFTPMFTLSADGCIISNVSFVQGNSEDGKASVGILCSGLRNYLSGVSVLTGQHANQGDEASYSVQVTGEENVFERCYIGTDTISRGGAVSANVRFGSGSTDQAARNIFRECLFPMFADDTDPVFVLADATNDTQRWQLFERCNFLNTGSSTLTAGIEWSDTAGKCFLNYSSMFGVTDITQADSTLVLVSGATSTGAAAGLGLYVGVDITA